MGAPLAYYWSLELARRQRGHSGVFGGSCGGRDSEREHEVWAQLRGRAAWDAAPEEGADNAAENTGWNHDFGDAGFEVSLAKPVLEALPEAAAQKSLLGMWT